MRTVTMTRFQRRIKRLEQSLTDESHFAPNTPRWWAYWSEKIRNYMEDPEPPRPAVLFPLAALRAFMQSDEDDSLLESSEA